jgi:hypothetical protein
VDNKIVDCIEVCAVAAGQLLVCLSITFQHVELTVVLIQLEYLSFVFWVHNIHMSLMSYVK